MAGTLFLVATPIGNLGDITLRALETLRGVDLIACEDTRHTSKLLNHFEISKPLLSYHEHNEQTRSDELIRRLAAGDDVAVVSDAGTPGISDPGHVLVRKAIDAGLSVVPLPGPAAFVNAVIASGMPTDSIFFGGFLPSRKGERRRRLGEASTIPATLVFYESPHRLTASLLDCLEVLGNRQAAVIRELTKLHEEIARGTLGELSERFADAKARGEFVLVIDRAGEEARTVPAESISQRVKQLEAEGMDPRSALKAAAREFGVSRSEAYRQLQGS